MAVPENDKREMILRMKNTDKSDKIVGKPIIYNY